MTMKVSDAGEFPIRFSRTASLNAVSLGLSGVFAAITTTAPFVVMGIPWWLKLLGPLLSLVLLNEVRTVVQDRDLAVEIDACELRWHRRGLNGRIDLHDVREFYIDEPRKYRIVHADGSTSKLDFRALYHVRARLDKALSEVITAQLLGPIAHAIDSNGRHDFGPISVLRQSRIMLKLSDLVVPIAETNLILGHFLVTLGNSRSKELRSAPLHEVPNIEALAMTVRLLKEHSVGELVNMFPAKNHAKSV